MVYNILTVQRVGIVIKLSGIVSGLSVGLVQQF